MRGIISLYCDKYKDDERFEFIRLKDKGHNYIFNDRTYIDEFNAEFGEWLKTLDYDYNAKEKNDRFKTDKANYIHQHLDRSKWCNMLDTELFARFLGFYNDNI